MKPFVHEIRDIDLLQAFANVKHMPYSLLLDSSDRNHKESRYSFVACQPIETIEAKDGMITVTNWEQRLSFKERPFKILKSRIESWIPQTEHIPNLPPFQGGAAGLFSYDLSRYLEELPETIANDSAMPDMAIGLYDQVLARDHLTKKTWIFTHARNEKEAEKKRNFLLNIFSQPVKQPNYEPTELDWQSNFTKQEYIEHIEKIIQYIYDGDIFQANFAQKLSAELPTHFDPFAHYLHMRETNPVPFGAYLNLADIKIASASPERFITSQNGQITTSPIKGTRPRTENVIEDRKNKNALQNSEKDNAENTMIVDLLRNDLSRVCTPESINVSKLCELESFAGVHHLVSTITAQLKEGKKPVDLLRACFPGGSITGAPKIRAMEIIEECERACRNAYCGSIGYIGFDNIMDTNILIRTLIYEKQKVSLSVGGGIVADSVPEEEYQETLDKAELIRKSFAISTPENIHLKA